jgi:DNA-binding CsgD family transcriptional regulator
MIVIAICKRDVVVAFDLAKVGVWVRFPSFAPVFNSQTDLNGVIHCMEKPLKEICLELRAKGESYRKIGKKLNITAASVFFHCSSDEKKRKTVDRTRIRARERKRFFVAKMGGKCNRCGYNKCLAALDFHHKNPEEKDKDIMMVFRMKYETIEREVAKCELVCANCHREIHDQDFLDS